MTEGLKKKGFTLIELLVVIAIIAILAAILFPVFARAREKAKSTTCQSNIKSILLSFKMYENDYDGKMPSPNNGLAGRETWHDNIFVNYEIGWIQQIQSYAKNYQILKCATYTTVEIGYGYNPFLQWSRRGERVFPAGCSESDVRDAIRTVCISDVDSNPSTTPQEGNFDLVMDTNTTVTDGVAAIETQYPPYDITGSIPMGGAPEPRHSEGCNFGFVDGHAKWLKNRLQMIFDPNSVVLGGGGALQ